jgi:spore coat polysaccharide biosynthesis protein SpsF
MPLGGETVLGVLIARLRQVPEIDRVVLATTVNRADDVLEQVAQEGGVDVFRGSEDDVLGRVCGALDAFDAEICVEITGDCPLTDPSVVSAMIREFRSTRGINAYVSNTTGPELGAPPGLDVQVFEADALRTIEREIKDADAREHVSLPFYREPTARRFNPRFVSFFPAALCRSVWISLDYQEDYDLIRDIHSELAALNPIYSAEAIIAAAKARPEMTRACLNLRGW